MRELRIDRRRLLGMGISSGLLLMLPSGCVRLGGSDAALLLDVIGGDELPTDPERTGTLASKSVERLLGLCDFVDRGWELGGDMEPYLDRLRGDLATKAGERPSYLTEYENAAEMVGVVTGESGSLDQAWASLLFAEIESEAPEQTRIGRARRLVFAEIVTHQVALSGGFRSFGLANYSGWFGGSFRDPASYRRGSR